MSKDNKDFEEQIRQSADQAYESEMASINEQLDKEIIFALIGDVNVGKSSTVNQLMKEDVALVSAKPGATIDVNRYNAENINHIIFADTPGLDDIVQDNSAETISFFKQADVNLFLLNAAGTVFSDWERQVFDKLRKLNDTIIFVLNKIDASDDPDTQVAYIKEQTGGHYDVVPISSRTGENMDALNKVILTILKKRSKDILYAKNSRRKSSIAHKWIAGAGASAGAIGALPVPGADVVPLTSLQVGLMVRLATLYEKPLSKSDAKDLTIIALTGSVGKTVFRQIVKFIPGAGTIAGAGVASTMTFALGYSVKYAYEHNLEINRESFSELYELFLKKGEGTDKGKAIDEGDADRDFGGSR